VPAVTLRVIVLLVGLITSLFVGQVGGSDILGKFAFFLFASSFIADLSKFATDQLNLRILYEKEHDASFWVHDTLIAQVKALAICCCLIPWFGYFESAILFLNASAIVLSRSLLPLWVFSGQRAFGLVKREAMITGLRAASFLPTLLFIAETDQFFLFSSILFYVFTVLIFILVVTQNKIISLSIVRLSSVGLHFKNFPFYLSTAPVALTSFLVSASLKDQGNFEILSIYYVLSRMFSFVNIFQVLSINHYNLDVLEKLRENKKISKFRLKIMFQSMLILLGIFMMLSAFGAEILKLWGLNSELPLFLIVYFIFVYVALAVSGPWFVVVSFFDSKEVLFRWSSALCIVLLCSFFLISNLYFLILALGAILATDRIFKLIFSIRLEHENLQETIRTA
jgi:hypothetical protein